MVTTPGELSVSWHLISPMPCVSISEARAVGVILRGSRLTAHNAQCVNKAALMNEEDSGSGGVGIVSAFTRRGKVTFT